MPFINVQLFIDVKIQADHSGVAAYYRIEERDIVQQLVGLAIACKDHLVELTDFALAYLDRDLSITSEKLTTALKVLIFHCFIMRSLYFFTHKYVSFSVLVMLDLLLSMYVCFFFYYLCISSFPDV